MQSEGQLIVCCYGFKPLIAWPMGRYYPRDRGLDRPFMPINSIKKNVGSQGFRVAIPLDFSAAALVYAAFSGGLDYAHNFFAVSTFLTSSLTALLA